MKKAALIVVALVLLGATAHGGEVTVKEGRFLDAKGRHIILNGVNVIEKNRAGGYVSWHGPEEFAQMRRWGFNCIRLGMTWAAVEPECGKYDEAFLDRLALRLKWAHENGLWVVLDMHQDLYSEAPPINSDGAPAWATITNGKPHINPEDGPWSMAYWTSEAVQAALDNFWKNTPGPDGVGIQDHYAKAWQHVAKRFAGEPALIGYDLMNEPFPGSGAERIVEDVMLALKNEPGIDPAQSPFVIVAMASSDMGLFRKLLKGATPGFQRFEKEQLGPMHNRVAAAIREVDPTGILFIEPSVSVNAGVPSALPAVTDAQGRRDPCQAFAAHAYDVVTDTDFVGKPDTGRLALIFERIEEHARKLEMPVWVGEWGAFYGRKDTYEAARLASMNLEQIGAGNAYWDFHGDLEKAVYFPLLSRPYATAVAGVCDKARFASEVGTFTCQWSEIADITEPTRIYVPEATYGQGFKIDLTPRDSTYTFEAVQEGAKAGWLVIPPTGGNGRRKLTLEVGQE